MAWQSIGRGECDHCGQNGIPVWDVSKVYSGQSWCLDCIQEKAS